MKEEYTYNCVDDIVNNGTKIRVFNTINSSECESFNKSQQFKDSEELLNGIQWKYLYTRIPKLSYKCDVTCTCNVVMCYK